METMRKQLVKKDELFHKTAEIQARQAVQYKQELKELSKKYNLLVKENEQLQHSFSHTNGLLETSFDQHQEEIATIGTLKAEVRFFNFLIYLI